MLLLCTALELSTLEEDAPALEFSAEEEPTALLLPPDVSADEDGAALLEDTSADDGPALEDPTVLLLLSTEEELPAALEAPAEEDSITEELCPEPDEEAPPEEEDDDDDDEDDDEVPPSSPASMITPASRPHVYNRPQNTAPAMPASARWQSRQPGKRHTRRGSSRPEHAVSHPGLTQPANPASTPASGMNTAASRVNGGLRPASKSSRQSLRTVTHGPLRQPETTTAAIHPNNTRPRTRII